MNPAPNLKYPHTRALIEHVVGQGWTQKQIAEKCNVKQSVVSDWHTGKKDARRSTIEPLLKKFGDVVNSTDFRVYHLFNGKRSINPIYSTR